MNSPTKVLAVIPARSGSKGVPRKNVRFLGGQPLISHTIKTLKNSGVVDRIIVSTNSDEIAYIAELLDVEVIKRPNKLAEDATTLDPVIKHVVNELQNSGDSFDIVMTVQPTSPFIKDNSIKLAVEKFSNNDINSVISVVEDKHLRWKYDESEATPLYSERINRQHLPNEYKETGGIIAVRTNKFTSSRIVNPTEMIVLDEVEGIDIDTPEDLLFSESLTKKKKIALWPCASIDKGMGHIYRQLLIADHLVSHDVSFCLTEDDTVGLNKIKETFYKYQLLKNSSELINWVIENHFDFIILDILDTTHDLVSKFKEAAIGVITFEDLGEGSKLADLSINALYNSDTAPEDNAYFGPDYFILRPEFSIINNNKKEDLNKITILFGGTDPNNISLLALSEIMESPFNLQINLILGPANLNSESLKKFVEEKSLKDRIKIIENTNKVSKYISESKVMICSGGQTLYEAVSLGVPAIVISQNKRELTHGLLKQNFQGIINLSDFDSYKKGSLHEVLNKALSNKKYYNNLVQCCENLKLKDGTKRIINVINNTLNN